MRRETIFQDARLRGKRPAFVQGWLQSDNGHARTFNPYSTDVMTEEGRQLYNDWEEGWNFNYYGETM